MKTRQTVVAIGPMRRGFHLITGNIEDSLPWLSEFSAGIAHLHLLHTSASLSLNENTDPDVRRDLETIMNRVVPENSRDYAHVLEGPDDMPAHGKSSILGTSIMIPVQNGRFLLGTWQGIYLGEHRNHGGMRKIAVTVVGD